jgi:DNA repair protein RecO (recombination protein O)
MIQKVKGIVLHHVKYRESSAILYLYTDKFGRQSYLVNNIRGKSSKYSGNLLQPLTLLELEAYHKPGRDLQRPREMGNYIPYGSITFDPHKSSQALFLAEILYKVLREEEPNGELFEFLENSLHLFDISEEGMENFHLLFLVRLTKYLGFYPDNNYGELRSVFDMSNGQFSGGSDIHPDFFDHQSSAMLHRLLELSFKELSQLSIYQDMRVKFLDNIMHYYRLHIQGFGTVKSLSVLHEIYRE